MRIVFKEREMLDANVRVQVKRRLGERLENPRVASVKLYGSKDRCKIKLRSVGYRLVYEVRDRQVLVVVITLGKRERNAVYKVTAQR